MALVAARAIGLLGPTFALAVSTCSFAGGVVTAAAPADGDTIKVYQDNNGGIHVAGDVAGAEPTTVAGVDDIATCNGSQFSVATTTTINITGATGVGAFDQTFWIEMTQTTAPGGVLNTTLENWGTVNWVINGGNNTAAGDSLLVENNGLTTAPLDVAAGANGIDLNNDGDLDVTTANVENFTFFTNSDADEQNIDLSGSTSTGAALSDDASVLASSTGDLNTFSGGGGDDAMTNTVDGGGDSFSPGRGNDNVSCGPGVGDLLDYSNTTTAINMNLSSGNVTQGADLDSVANCENGVGTNQGDTMIGDAQDNTFMPGAGSDVVTGGLAGENTDSYDVSDATNGVTVDLNTGTSTGGSGTDTLTEIEDFVGGSGGDVFVDDTDAGSGNVIDGGAGNDAYVAAPANGNDTFIDGPGFDTVDYSQRTTPQNLVLDGVTPSGDIATGESDLLRGERLIGGSGQNVVSGGPGNDVLKGGPGNDELRGEAGDDILKGGRGNDRLYGGDDRDTLMGGVGRDKLDGGTGNDALRGGTRRDTAIFSTAVSGVSVNLATGMAFSASTGQLVGIVHRSAFGADCPTGDETDTLMTVENINVPTEAADCLVGDGGANFIWSRDGDDQIHGRAGDDELHGGTGDDFIFGQAGGDTLFGDTGYDSLIGGSGSDICSGGPGADAVPRGCEELDLRRHASTSVWNRQGSAVADRLTRLDARDE